MSKIETLIEKSGCSKEYYALETCLGENDRSWSICRSFVKSFKDCNKIVTEDGVKADEQPGQRPGRKPQ